MLALVFMLGDCGAGDASAAKGVDEENGWGGSDDGEPGGWDWEDVATSADYGEPPEAEKELALDLKAPQASPHYVYVAATARDSLVRISADESLEIRLIPVGGQPTTVATLRTEDVAMVINRGTQDFSIVRSSDQEDKVKTLDMLPHVNAIAVSPDGKYAIVYYNDALAGPYDPTGDFQTVAVVSMEEKEEKVSYVSTGFHTTALYFHQTSPVAYLVTDDGVSIIELDKVKDGDITPIVPVTEDPLEDPSLREVLVSEDGVFAVVRSLANPFFNVVDLTADDKLVSVDVKGLPTDVDLIPSADKALLVLREEELAYVADLPGFFDPDPAKDDPLTEIKIAGSQAGASVVTADGSRAVLYSTVGGSKAVGVLNLGQDDYPLKSFPVQKSVVGVAVSEHGSTAVVFHEVEAYDPESADLNQTIAQANGFTLFSLDTGYRKLIQTDNPWSQFLFVSEPTGEDLKAYVLTPDPLNLDHSVESVSLGTFMASSLPLSSPPTSMVYVPNSRKVAVAQEHHNGRITFIDVDSGETYSVTGYELNGLIH